MRPSTAYVMIWFAAGVIGAYLALLMDTAAFVDGQYIPVGNDSFYHARRILDAAIGDRGLYQFDSMIHVPEGSWLVWPWGFDFLMAAALRAVLVVRPDAEPMAVLAHIPVLWTFVNTALLALIAWELRIAPALGAVALLAFALLPLNQSLHGLGIVDHHFIEMTFALATVWAGLRFFTRHESRDAIILGIVLGLAPAFHNGLFILQIPILAAAFVLWLRNAPTERAISLRLCAALVITTLAIALPSAPFRDGQFEFWTLSWFHLYVACGSAAVLAFFSLRSAGKAEICALFVAAIVLAAPLIGKLSTGTSFLAGDLILLDTITEVQSPLTMLGDPAGPVRVAALYSWLILLTPLLLLVYFTRTLRESDPRQVFLGVAVVFGLGLMLVQFRLHPFGSWAMILGAVVLLDEFRAKHEFSMLATTGAALAIVAVVMQPPLRGQLFETYSPGLSRDYATVRPLYPVLADACADAGGVVLTTNDDGHYVRYHTDCSVITNNFIMTPLHKQKILEARGYLELTPDAFPDAAPHVRFLLVRLSGIVDVGPDGIRRTTIDEVQQSNPTLFNALAFADSLPAPYRLVGELRLDDGRDFAYARVIEIVRD